MPKEIVKFLKKKNRGKLFDRVKQLTNSFALLLKEKVRKTNKQKI